jgi:hypothetical protein
LDKSGEGFVYFHSKFPALSDSKFTQRILVGPQITNLFLARISKGNLTSMKWKGVNSSDYWFIVFWGRGWGRES